MSFAFEALVLSCGGVDDGTVSAVAVEDRLIAQCCWTQTLDVHE